MGDLLAILYQGASSLGAYRGAAATASHNLENVNTPGYSRQNAELKTNLPAQAEGNAYIGTGVQLDTVRQVRDRFLEAQMPNAIATAARADTESQSLSALSALDPGMTGGMTDALSGFFSGITALAQNPGSSVLRQAAVDASSKLTSAFNSTSQSISTARQGLDDKMNGLVHQVNDYATQLASLNQKIRQARASGAEPNDLLDARTQLQDKISELSGATPVLNARGDVSMFLPDGVALVSEDQSASLSTLPDVMNNGHLALQITLADGTGPVPASSVGGRLGGVIDARDKALRKAENALDTLAYDLASAVNTIHQAGFAMDGTDGHALFDAGSSASGAAAHIIVDPTVVQNPNLLAAASLAASVPGDASNLYQIVSLQNATLANGKTPSNSLSQIIADYGSATQQAKAFSEQGAALRDNLQNMRESTSGVSIDEELVNLTRAQRAYEAVTRVINTSNEMLETLMQLK